MKKVIASILITAAASTAYAGDDPAYDIAQVAERLSALKHGDMQYELGEETLAKCLPAVEQARKAGKEKLGWYNGFTAFGDGTGHITLAQAEGICREGRYYREVVTKDLKVFKFFDTMMFAMLQGTNDMSYYKTVEEQADACDKAVEALLAAKVDPATPFEVGASGHMAKTVGEIKPNLCDAARTAAQRIYKEKTAKDEAARAPYEQVGIAGDKLDFVLKHDDGSIWLTGKRDAPDPKSLAKASTMFIWTTSDPDGWNYVVHDVYKYVFKGNKLVKSTNKSYRMKYGATLGAAAFK